MSRYTEVNEMAKCACCGKLLPMGGIRAERASRAVEFCAARCVEVFDDYKYPKYGDAAFAGLPKLSR